MALSPKRFWGRGLGEGALGSSLSFRSATRHSSESWNPAFRRQEQQQRLDSSFRWNDKPFARPIYKAVIPAKAGIQLPGSVFADTEKLDTGLRRYDEQKKEAEARSVERNTTARCGRLSLAPCSGGQGLRKFDRTESLTAFRAVLSGSRPQRSIAQGRKRERRG
jgi:hypothetical protein